MKVFGPGRSPGYPPGRPRDIPPKNFVFRPLPPILTRRKNQAVLHGCPSRGGATLKVRQGAFNALNQGGRPGKPNQRKADSQAGSRIWGVFVNLACFLENKETSQKSAQFANLRCFCEVSLFFFSRKKNTPNSRKHPKFANRLANRPFFGLVCRFDS